MHPNPQSAQCARGRVLNVLIVIAMFGVVVWYLIDPEEPE